MTTKSLELKFWHSAKDRDRVLRFLRDRSDTARGRGGGLLANPVVEVAADLFILFMLVQGVMEMRALVSAQGWGVMFLSEFLVGNFIGLFLAIVLIQSVWRQGAKSWRWIRGARATGEGVSAGEHRLKVSPDGVSVRLAKRRTNYKWPAVLELADFNDMLLLVITPREAVAVPRSAFQSEDDERAFRDYVGAHIATA